MVYLPTANTLSSLESTQFPHICLDLKLPSHNVKSFITQLAHWIRQDWTASNQHNAETSYIQSNDRNQSHSSATASDTDSSLVIDEAYGHLALPHSVRVATT